MAEPMITIKKADGTFIKVPLSQLKKNQTAPQKPTEPAKPAAHHQPVQHHIKAHAPAAHHVVKHHSVHVKEHKKEHHSAPHHVKQMSRADAGSPLEEKLKTKTSAPLFSPKREKQVEEVLAKLGFSVAPDTLGRLKSLVLAKLKDIKSEDETRELLGRSIKNGGLGLTEQQVDKIIKSCREVEGQEEGGSTSVPSLKGRPNHMSLMVEPPELPAVPSSVAPMPYNKIDSFKSSVPSSGMSGNQMLVDKFQKKEVVSKLINENIGNEAIFKLGVKQGIKQSMQDVTASTIEMGPVEEIKSMTLTDFRRLSSNPMEAAKRLQQKMFNLQEESFVWYLQALAAYHVSPLYLEYIQAVCQSLAERKSLANVLVTKNSIKLNEAMALIEMEHGL